MRVRELAHQQVHFPRAAMPGTESELSPQCFNVLDIVHGRIVNASPGNIQLEKPPAFAYKRKLRRGGRVVDGSSLENWRGCKPTVGSNPTLSAICKQIQTLLSIYNEKQKVATLMRGSVFCE